MAFADTNTRVILQGIGPVKVSLATPVSRGDLLAISATTQWAPASASTSTSLFPARLVAGETGETDDTITAFMQAVVGNFPSVASLAALYLSTTAGDYATASGATAVQMVGGMVASTVGIVAPVSYGVSAGTVSFA